MALSGMLGTAQATGYEPGYQGSLSQGGSGSSMAAVAQLFARLSQEIEEQKPKNCIHFIVDFLCKHYPEHLHGFASIWQMDPDLERERHEVVNFFKAHKISTAVAAHFTNAGYDTLDTLTTLSPDSLVDVEAFNNVKWLPGHKVRLQQIFGEISARVRAYRQQYGAQHRHGHHGRGHHHHASHAAAHDLASDPPSPVRRALPHAAHHVAANPTYAPVARVAHVSALPVQPTHSAMYAPALAAPTLAQPSLPVASMGAHTMAANAMAANVMAAPATIGGLHAPMTAAPHYAAPYA